jgi:hypothetical protein
MSFGRSVLRTLIVFFVLSGSTFGQRRVAVGFGIRGGLANQSVQANELCSSATCAIGPSFSAFMSNGLNGTFGPTVDVLLDDKVEVRFEAAHRRFGFQIHTDIRGELFEQRFDESARGHLWEYPLLATYHFRSGPARPFAGGGVSLGTSGAFDRETQLTFTDFVPAPSTTPTTMTGRATGLPLRNRTPFYFVAGIDGRVLHISIRPEFRYSHFSTGPDSNAEAILKSNQFEFLLGLSFQVGLGKLETRR